MKIKIAAGAVLLALISGVTGYAIAKTPPVSGASGSIRVIYSLDRKQNDQEIISVINNAKSYVYFAVYEFTLTDIADALMAAKKRGVDVEGITDADNATSGYEDAVLAELKAASIPVEVQHHSGIMHVKAVVTESQYASGSYNWTYTATTENDEVLEIGSDPSVRAQYERIIKEIIAANASGTTASIGQSETSQLDSPTGTIDYTEAPNHIGQTMSVIGSVVKVAKSSSGTIFFDYCSNYKNCPFSAVIFASKAGLFSNVSQYQGRTITVTGKISSYQGQAEIILDSPSQIQ